MVNYSKLKTNLKISIQRLKLLEKKKTENAKKSTKEIADYMRINKIDRAKIKVEHIIREDYIVEALEILEMYCDLLLARFGLVESMKELDEGLCECVASILWASPRVESECAELKIVSNELQYKYGKEFANMCRENRSREIVNEKLMQKMSEQAPGDLLIEKYLVEIAKSHNVEYTPNPELAVRDPDFFYDVHERKGGPSGGAGGSSGGGGSSKQSASYVDYSLEKEKPPAPPKDEDFLFPVVPDSKFDTINNAGPSDSFDDLAKRFENLKKK